MFQRRLGAGPVGRRPQTRPSSDLTDVANRKSQGNIVFLLAFEMASSGQESWLKCACISSAMVVPLFSVGWEFRTTREYCPCARVCLQSIVFTRNSTKETATETRSYRRKSKGTGSTRLDGQKVPETIQDETSKSPGANDSNRKHRQIHRAEKQLRR